MNVQDKIVPGPDLQKRLSKLIAGQSIARILRADEKELVIELENGSRVFARSTAKGLDISVT